MTELKHWVAGARPRTLPAAIAPVLVGTSAAGAVVDDVVWWRAGAAMVVALALQIGVNYANDYSDGVRGTDEVRAGPLRLTASGTATPHAVRVAAGLSFAVAAVAGLVLSLAVEPLLLIAGVAAVAAAVLYTGGPKPYGYLGLGEVMVLVFFGVVATAGSAYVQAEHVPATAWWGSAVVGLLACAILLANNVRDVPTDAKVGKHTLAVRVGDRRARHLYVGAVVLSFVAVLGMATEEPWALLGLFALPLAVTPIRAVLTATTPRDLIPALAGTTKLELVVGVLVSLGLWLG